MEQIKGKASLKFEKDIYIMCSASVVGKKEGEGPLNKYYDLIVEDPTVGKDTWEEGESELINKATGILLIWSLFYGRRGHIVRCYDGGRWSLYFI